MNFDHILIIGFGGPRRPEEVRPFVLQVTKGKEIPKQRLWEVERRYQRLGGHSPYNEHVFRFVDRFKELLGDLPVFTAMRNWYPFLEEIVVEIKSKQLKKGIAIILAPHRSEASFDCYVEALEQAKSDTGSVGIEYQFVPPWHDHKLFIRAQTDEIRRVLDELSPEDREALHILFTAHSIPMKMAERSRYSEEVRNSTAGVIKELNHPNWSIGYQSRSGAPNEPWLGPHVLQIIPGLKGCRLKTILVVPIGFLCDNAEILYDLDIELCELVEENGLQYKRAQTVIGNGNLMRLFVELVETMQARDRVHITQTD